MRESAVLRDFALHEAISKVSTPDCFSRVTINRNSTTLSPLGNSFSTLKSIANNVQLGNKSATDVADSVNAWIKESSEALKVKIEDEVERSFWREPFSRPLWLR